MLKVLLFVFIFLLWAKALYHGVMVYKNIDKKMRIKIAILFLLVSWLAVLYIIVPVPVLKVRLF
jgi:hypothetical protein